MDEIGDISPALQVRLLRVFQDRVYEPLGSTKSQKVDVRFVAATNKDLDILVKEGKFREDLYYRVHVVKLALPPLRDRKEDIPLLTEHFVQKFCRLSGKEIHGLSPEVLPILMSHDFPGNIRELENIIEHAIVVCRDEVISIEHLPEYLYQKSAGLKGTREKGASLDDMERSFLYEALRQNNWSRAATAAQLGIHNTTLWRKMKRLHLDLPHKDGRTRGK